MFKKLFLSSAIASALVASNVGAQSIGPNGSGSGCVSPLFLACASWSITGGPTSFQVSLTNTSASGIKFSELLLFYSGARPTLTNITTVPSDWTVSESSFSGGVYLNGVTPSQSGTMNFEWNKPQGSGNAGNLFNGESLVINFTATAGAQPFVLTGVGAHVQGGGTGGQLSMRTQFVCIEQYTRGGCGTVVPEPATGALMLAGFAGLVGVARRRRKA